MNYKKNSPTLCLKIVLFIQYWSSLLLLLIIIITILYPTYPFSILILQLLAFFACLTKYLHPKSYLSNLTFFLSPSKSYSKYIYLIRLLLLHQPYLNYSSSANKIRKNQPFKAIITIYAHKTKHLHTHSIGDYSFTYRLVSWKRIFPPWIVYPFFSLEARLV